MPELVSLPKYFSMKRFYICLLCLFLLGACHNGVRENGPKVFSEQAKAEAKARIEGYRQRVLKGEGMADLAAKYSEDPGSAKNGGRYDNIAKGQFVPAFEKAALQLKPGGISEVFETQYGFHFVQLISIHDDLMDVRHILVVPK